MCLIKAPKAPPPPPPPPPVPDTKAEEALRERYRLVRRKGQYISPYAVQQGAYLNPAAQKTLLGA